MDPLLHMIVLAYLQIMMTQTSSEIRFDETFYFSLYNIFLQTAHQLQLPACAQRPDRVEGEAGVPRPQPLAPLCVGVAPRLENMQTQGRAEKASDSSKSFLICFCL